MPPLVKVCGITTPEDAHRAVELGADYVGVILYPKSPRYVPIERVPDILAAIPGGKRVMVDVNPPSTVLEEHGDLGFDAFQIHFDLELSLAVLAAWSGIVGPDCLWLAPRIPPQESFPQVILGFAETVVLDSYSKDAYGGTGKAGNWERFAEWKTLYQHKRFVLTGGLGPDNIAAALEATGPAMIDVNSGVESAPGVKDFDKLARLMDTVRDLYARRPECWE